MLKIQVLGRGMIPRGYGLAPRLEPFPADFTLITTIMSTPGLSVNMIHPENDRVIPLTNQNVKRMYETYANYKPKNNAPAATSPAIPAGAQVKTPDPVNVVPPVQTQQKPVTVIPPVQEKKTEVPVQEPEKVEEKADTKEEKKDASTDSKTPDQQKNTTFKPINSDDRKGGK